MADPSPRRALRLALALALGAATTVTAPTASGQVPGDDGGQPATSTSTTSTTAAPTTTTTSPAPPSGDQLSDQSNAAPPGAEDSRGDGAAAPPGGIVVPPEAQKIIDSVRRSRSNSTDALLQLLPQIRAFGLSESEAYRIGFGRFPIAGPARYSHDWLYPRYGPGFRFHLGTDVFAAQGTPVRAPVDGVAISEQDSLGGLTVKVVMEDRTYFYLAHLSGLAPGFVDGMAVATGDIVGYVGDSGNARGGTPHLHIGIYPKGGPPIDPKPILDQFLAEAIARVPEVVAALAASQPTPSQAPLPRAMRELLTTDVARPLARNGERLPDEVVYLVGANAVEGPRALLDLAVADLIAEIDWYAGY